MEPTAGSETRSAADAVYALESLARILRASPHGGSTNWGEMHARYLEDVAQAVARDAQISPTDLESGRKYVGREWDTAMIPILFQDAEVESVNDRILNTPQEPHAPRESASTRDAADAVYALESTARILRASPHGSSTNWTEMHARYLEDVAQAVARDAQLSPTDLESGRKYVGREWDTAMIPILFQDAEVESVNDRILNPQTASPQPAPLIADLVADHRAHYLSVHPGLKIHETEDSAQTFEYSEHRRLKVWDEANFMGDIDGYSWQEELWTGSEWVDVTGISTENGDAPLTEGELIDRRVREFLNEAEAGHPSRLSAQEASLDRLARQSLGQSASFARIVGELQRDVRTLNDRLDRKDAMLNQTRAALLNTIEQLPKTSAPQPAQQEPTGPVTHEQHHTGPAPDIA